MYVYHHLKQKPHGFSHIFRCQKIEKSRPAHHGLALFSELWWWKTHFLQPRACPPSMYRHWEDHTHRIHGAAIYGNIYHQYTPNVSIYIYHTWILCCHVAISLMTYTGYTPVLY